MVRKPGRQALPCTALTVLMRSIMSDPWVGLITGRRFPTHTVFVSPLDSSDDA